MERVERWWAGAVIAVPHAPERTRAMSAAESDTPRAALAGLDDPALVAACLAGAREAFDVIVQRHRRPVYQVCYRYVGNHEDASDVAQEVFLRAYRALRGFKGDASIGTWLYRIAVNACLNRLAARHPAADSIESSVAIADRAPDPASRLLQQEQSARVRAAIARLPGKQRTTLILRVYQELSHQEIASIVGSSVGAVKANFFHALRNLKKILEQDETEAAKRT